MNYGGSINKKAFKLAKDENAFRNSCGSITYCNETEIKGRLPGGGTFIDHFGLPYEILGFGILGGLLRSVRMTNFLISS